MFPTTHSSTPNVSKNYPKLYVVYAQCLLFASVRAPKSSRYLPRLFALVIGIDNYPQMPLKGAVKDAEDIENLLINSWSVPPSRIKMLRNGDATKDCIIEELQALSTNKEIEKDDAILVYFAGHGSTCAPPEGWTSSGRIEMICPVDISAEDAAEPRTGIPDIVLNLLIGQLAVAKGDNIVRSHYVILQLRQLI